MKTWICEICGDAYLGTNKPSECPFCGARGNFIKLGSEAKPVVTVKEELSDITKNNLEETLKLEMTANAIYTCMAGKALTLEINKMYKCLAKVELEHAVICTKLLGIEMPQIDSELCSDEDIENFQKTIELEERATDLYREFAKTSTEKHVKIIFTALAQVEGDHIELIKNCMS